MSADNWVLPRSLAAADTPISAVLSHGGLHVGVETSLELLAAVLLRHPTVTAAVTNDIGAVVGVISTADLWATAQRDDAEQLTAQELMHGPTALLPETASLATAAALMAVEGANALPIACSSCESICVLSALDILSWLGRNDRASLQQLAQELGQ